MKKYIKESLRTLIFVPVLALAAGVAVPVMVDDAAAETSAQSGANSAKGSDHEKVTSLDGDQGLFRQAVNILLYIIGAISVIMLIIGGIRYVVSGGDSSAVTAAKNTILYAVIGIIVALLAYALVNFVITSFKGA